MIHSIPPTPTPILLEVPFPHTFRDCLLLTTSKDTMQMSLPPWSPLGPLSCLSTNFILLTTLLSSWNYLCTCLCPTQMQTHWGQGSLICFTLFNPPPPRIVPGTWKELNSCLLIDSRNERTSLSVKDRVCEGWKPFLALSDHLWSL